MVNHQKLFWLLSLSLVTGSCLHPKKITSVDAQGYTLVFDGKTLDGWLYDPVYWRVENGNLVGEVTEETLLKRNSFIIKKNLVTEDFDLIVEYRISEHGNSGINYRSVEIDSLPYAMRGYQADIDGQNLYTGQNYEERKRTTLAYQGEKVTVDSLFENGPWSNHIKDNAWMVRTVNDTLGNAAILKSKIKSNDWNEYHLIVRGNRMLHYVNGILMSDVTDNDPVNRKFSGGLGVQVHVGPPMKIEYRNFRIKKL